MGHEKDCEDQEKMHDQSEDDMTLGQIKAHHPDLYDQIKKVIANYKGE